MPYKIKQCITITPEAKLKLDKIKSEDESWSEYLIYLMNYYIKNELDLQKNNKKKS